jgi:hypothetical protein
MIRRFSKLLDIANRNHLKWRLKLTAEQCSIQQITRQKVQLIVSHQLMAIPSRFRRLNSRGSRSGFRRTGLLSK